MTYVTDVIKEHSLSHLLAIKCFTVLTRTAHLSYLPSVLRPPPSLFSYTLPTPHCPAYLRGLYWVNDVSPGFH